MAKKSLTGYLKKCREKRGLSQKEVSVLLGYSSPQFISNWERGESDPPVKVLAKLAKIYRIPDSELLAKYIECVTSRIEAEYKIAKKK